MNDTGPVSPPPAAPPRRLELIERLDAAAAYERALVAGGAVPDTGKLPHRRLAPLLILLGAAALAVNVAVLTLLGNFIVFNMMIHASF